MNSKKPLIFNKVYERRLSQLFTNAMFRGTRFIFKIRIINIFKKNIKWLIEVVNFQMQGEKTFLMKNNIFHRNNFF